MHKKKAPAAPRPSSLIFNGQFLINKFTLQNHQNLPDPLVYPNHQPF